MIYNFNLLQDFVHGLYLMNNPPAYLRAQYYIVALVILLVQYCNVHDENVVVQSKIIIIYQLLYIYTIYTINIFMLLEIAG